MKAASAVWKRPSRIEVMPRLFHAAAFAGWRRASCSYASAASSFRPWCCDASARFFHARAYPGSMATAFRSDAAA